MGRTSLVKKALSTGAAAGASANEPRDRRRTSSAPVAHRPIRKRRRERELMRSPGVLLRAGRVGGGKSARLPTRCLWVAIPSRYNRPLQSARREHLLMRTKRVSALLVLVLLVGFGGAAPPSPPAKVGPVPEALRKALRLDP